MVEGSKTEHELKNIACNRSGGTLAPNSDGDGDC